jgi:peptidoglycan/LPS O-acetylase OafA/YrhL
VPPGREERDVVVQSGERRIASIESLRAVAAIGVLVGHIMLRYRPQGQGVPDYLFKVLVGGGFGVVLFFCLTGYLLFWPFVQQHYLGSSAVPLRRYALNRVLRILPLYYVAVVLLIVLRDPQGITHVWLKHLLLLQNFSRDSVASDRIDGVLWSVIVEMHFYLLLPFLAWGVAALTRRSLARTSVVLGAMAAVSLALWLHYWQHLHDPLWRLNLPASFFFFTGGMQLALLRAAFTRRRPAALDGWARHGDAYLLIGLTGFLLVCLNYSWVSVLALTCPFLLAPFVLGLRHGPLVRALSWKPLALTGVVSYSIYVWHVPVMSLFVDRPGEMSRPDILATVLLTAVVATASYHLIESPFLRLRRRWTPSRQTAEPAQRSAPAPLVETPAGAGLS